MAQAAEPPSGTRDFLAAEVRGRERAFTAVRAAFERYGFEPLQTPAFERLDVLTGKYGDEGDKLIFKILRRGEHEASGEADLALRYDLTVPLARVVATYGNRLPMPYKRYALGPVWRADRPGRGRFREFIQCDLDVVGSSSPLADAEIVLAINDGLTALGLSEFQIEVNSRRALYGLLDAYGVPEQLGGAVLTTLDKLGKLNPDAVTGELIGRGLGSDIAAALVADLSGEDTDRVRKQLDGTERGRAGLAEVDRLLALVTRSLPAGRVAFTPRMVRGLDYYTGPIFEVSAPGFAGSIASGGRYDGLVAALGGPDLPACGGSIGIERILSQRDGADTDAVARLDVALPVLADEAAPVLLGLASELRRAGLRVGVYLGGSGKIAKQLKWANDQRARFAVLLGRRELTEDQVSIRDMASGEQRQVPLAEAAGWLRLHATAPPAAGPG